MKFFVVRFPFELIVHSFTGIFRSVDSQSCVHFGGFPSAPSAGAAVLQQRVRVRWDLADKHHGPLDVMEEYGGEFRRSGSRDAFGADSTA